MVTVTTDVTYEYCAVDNNNCIGLRIEECRVLLNITCTKKYALDRDSAECG